MRRIMLLSILVLILVITGCATKKSAEPALATPDATAVAPMPKTSELVLLPMPKSVKEKSGMCILPRQYSITPGDSSQEAFSHLCGSVCYALDLAAVNRMDSEKQKPLPVTLAINSGKIQHPQGYLLNIAEDEIEMIGADAPGLFYAVMTLTQIARQCAGQGALPCLNIEDWPDFQNRGVLLDVARDKVPEMRTLYALVNRLAEWKCNQLQLYTEHTFAYRNHPIVWQDASPMTAVQIQRLDAYCKERFIELVPNQNSFGHMGRWLKHEQYRHLGEMPDGGSEDLCPIDLESIALLADMYNDLLPNFSSKQVNVGCDETWSLGKGRSKEACDKDGVGRVYLDFLKKINTLVSQQDRAMQFWGDIIMQHPELIPELPNNVIAMEWGYEAKHPFAEHGKKFAASKIPFYVVPGTSTWNSLVGRTDNAMANLLNAAENGLANGAIGYLITDWGDNGHWQFLPASYLGFAYGAAVSWSVETNKDLPITRALDVHVFQDEAGVMGKLAYDLGNAYMKCGVMPGNSSIFYTLLLYGLEGTLPKELTSDGLKETITYIDQVMAPLFQAKMKRSDAGLIAKEFALSADFMRLACRIGQARLDAGNVGASKIPADQRHALAKELEPLIPEFRQLWLARNRSGGLKESAGRFEALLAILNAP
ncbi:MAG TPA: glycoside hydrolase family 20 zincin-like fold domain-containing protein [Candidatus Hydrogenedentes bacterium]|nr:glycoside hydrolase family 20 zincin-like fold domain-containing protein [Candidatus Hydrogenedentota bacterium]